MIKVLKFEADWCGPCAAMDKELDKCRTDFELVRVNIETDTGATRLHRIRSVPTLIILKDDVEIGRLNGRQTAAKLDKFIREAG